MNIPIDFQANIIKSHGRNHAAFILIYFKNSRDDSSSIKLIREWVIKMGNQYITSHQKQCSETLKFKNSDIHSFVYNLAFSSSGYKTMGIADDFCPEDRAFKDGMNKYRTPLHDYFSDGIERQYNGSEDDRMQHKRIDAILTIAHKYRTCIDEKIKEIESQPEFKGAAFSHFIEYGYNEPGSLGNGSTMAPLGFSDGHSSNKMEAREAFLLTAVPEKYPSGNTSESYGSYFVFRKMGVDSDVFETMTKRLAAEIGKDEEFAAALFVGRFRNGTPLISFCQSEDVDKWSKDKQDLPFDYSGDDSGNKCPIHAHIRAVNPRINGPKPSSIIRRGMNFCFVTANIQDDLDNCTSNKKADGLLFMSYQKSLIEQFEAIFSNMEKNRDALVYRPNQIRPAVKVKFPRNYGQPERTSCHKIGGNELTQFRGGEYFFAPSITFLKNIDKFPIPTP